jgi:hypothetical protein
MRKITYIVLALAMFTMGSCKKYLSQVPDDVITVDKIFASRINTQNFLNNIYHELPNELAQRYNGTDNSGPWTASSDEAKYKWDFNYSNNMNTSTWSNTDAAVSQYWNNYYKSIRNATYFIEKIDGANPAEVGPDVKKVYKAEARALRALYYYFLLRTYGPVPLIGETVQDVNAPVADLRIARNSFDEGIDYVVAELDAAYTDLPLTTAASDFGRITKGVCKGYKVEALLLKASPLYNGNTDFAALKNSDGKQLISQSYDEAKWTAAATAAKAFIDEFVPGTYKLYQVEDDDPFIAAYKSCRDVMTTTWNQEWIFARSNSGNYLQYDRTPRHVGAPSSDQGYQGAGALGVTQTMVDAYFMANGHSIDDATSGYVKTGFSSFQAPFDVIERSTYNQWVNREPRFYVGVTYNNSYWLNQVNNSNIITNFFYNGNSGRSQSTSDVSPTGYVVRKNVAADGSGRGALLLRLANIYLDYAEALNEATPGSADILKYVNLIRARAGVPQYGSTDLAAPAGQEAMRLAIRKERRVELAFENVRYFDTRRWKIADVTDNGAFYGMDMSKSDNSFYNNVQLETRVFRKERDYLFPIPKIETLKNNNMVQNPGW